MILLNTVKKTDRKRNRRENKFIKKSQIWSIH